MRYVYDFDEESPRRPGAARRQGRRARRDDGARGARAGRLHDHDRRVPRVHGRGRQVPDGLDDEVGEHIAALEEKAGKRFGDPSDPLLVSVRSGAAISMPGMMDTILNLGLNDVAVEGLAASTGNPRFAYDSYRRLIQMYGEVVDGVDAHRFEQALTDLKARARRRRRTSISAPTTSRELIVTFKRDLRGGDGSPFPQDAREQLRRAVPGRLRLVGRAARAGLPAHVRDPGRPRHGRQRRPDGVRQQGRQLGHGRVLHARPVDRRGVALRRVPRQRAGRGRRRRASARPSRSPRCASGCRRRSTQLTATLERLEAHYRDMQDIEFTVEEGTLFLLQTRTGKRTAGGGAPDRGRDGGRGADLEGGGGGADRRRPARPAAPPDDRPRRRRWRSPRRG